MNKTRNFLSGLILVVLSSYFCFGGLLVIGEYNGISNFVIGMNHQPLFWIYSYVLASIFAAFGFNFIDRAFEGSEVVKINSFHFIVGIVWSLCSIVFNGGLCLLTTFCIFTQ